MHLLVLMLTACGWLGEGPGVEQPGLEPGAQDQQSKKKRKRQAKAARIAAVKRAAAEAHAQPQEEVAAAGLDVGQDLLFITWDTIRADHMSTYGYNRETTPFVTELAEQGVLFERFIVPMSTTLPSHTTFFTGLAPEEHGVLANVTITGERFVPSDKVIPLAEHLRLSGYYTIGVVSSAPLKSFTGIELGFDRWDEPPGEDRLASASVDAALSFLEEAPQDQPVLLWVHLVDPHWPYKPPESHANLWPDDGDLDAYYEARDFTSSKGPAPRRAPVGKRRDAYDGEVRFTDDQTRRLVGAWKAGRSWARTVMVLAGDHGEGLGEHGVLEHGLMWHEEVHAPWLMLAPGLEPRRVPYTVSGEDVLTTLLGIADLPEEATLLAQASGQDVLAADHTPRDAVTRLSYRWVLHKNKAAGFSVTGERFKLIANEQGVVRLFDLPADPHERWDVSSQHPEVAAEMLAYGEGRIAAQQARGVLLGTGRTEGITPTQLGELEALGYVE